MVINDYTVHCCPGLPEFLYDSLLKPDAFKLSVFVVVSLVHIRVHRVSSSGMRCLDRTVDLHTVSTSHCVKFI